MTLRRQLPPNIRSALRVVAVFYGVVVLGTLALTIWRYLYPGESSFLTSFLASLWEDILFFGIVGLAVLWVSIKRPQDEVIETRLWYLFSSPNVTKEAMDYNTHQISKLAAFANRGLVCIYISDYREEIGYRVHVDNEFHVANMFENRPYQDDQVQVRVVPDPVQTLEGIVGGIEQLRVTNDDGTVEKIIDHGFNIKGEYNQYITLKIGPNRGTTYEYKFWVWAMVGEPVFVAVNRFSQNITIILYNRTKDWTITYSESESEEPQGLEPGTQQKLKSGLTLRPGERFKVYLREPVQAAATRREAETERPAQPQPAEVESS